MSGRIQMESHQSSAMRISWVIADNANLDPLIDHNDLKNIGPIWGSWKSWRQFKTDNVICYDFKKAHELLSRNFQEKCNFYIKEEDFVSLERPTNVKLFRGQFPKEIDNCDDIVSMHLASSQSDIVLLLGFDLVQKNIADKLKAHQQHVYLHLVKSTIQSNSNVQWVILDQPKSELKTYKDLTNFTTDTLQQVLKQF